MVALEGLMQICPAVRGGLNWYKPSYQQTANNTAHYAQLNSAKRLVPTNTFGFSSIQWNGKEFRENSGAERLVEVLTNHGYCYTFNLLRMKDILKPNYTSEYDSKNEDRSYETRYWKVESGYESYARFLIYPLRNFRANSNSGYLMKFHVKTEADHLPCTEEESHQFKVLVHHPGNWPYFSQKTYKVSFNTKATLVVTPKLTKTEAGLRSYKPAVWVFVDPLGILDNFLI